MFLALFIALEVLVKYFGDRVVLLDAGRFGHRTVPAVLLPQVVERVARDGTKSIQKAKKSAGANLLTLAFLGSPTWARTRDLRINSPALYRLSYRGTASNYSAVSRRFFTAQQ